MPCSDPLPSNAEMDWQARHSKSLREAAELLCVGDTEELRRVLGKDFIVWLTEHRAIDQERVRLRDAGSYHVR